MTHLVSTDVKIREREMTEEWLVGGGRRERGWRWGSGWGRAGGVSSEEEMEKTGG